MKKIIPLLLIVFLVGCTSQAYKDNLELGTEKLEATNYEEAIEAFEKAKEEKSTDEVKELLQVTKNLKKSQQAFEDGDFEKSIKYAEKVTALKSDSEAVKIAIKKANELIEQVQLVMADIASIKEGIKDGEALLEQEKFSEAYEVFDSIVSRDIKVEHDAIKKLINQTIDLKNEAIDKKEESLINAETDTEPNTSSSNNPDSNENSTTNGNSNEGSNVDINSQNSTDDITQAKAEKIVKDYLGINASSSLKAEYNGQDDNGNHIFQVYEMILDDPTSGEGHTATWGWYGVNKQTGEVFDALQ